MRNFIRQRKREAYAAYLARKQMMAGHSTLVQYLLTPAWEAAQLANHEE